ncbi:penicillin-binding protein activator [Blastomonas aquatica]|uniref:Penicillin-binding protein activator n=1 Tax=Blastomonas aquatica TaxID=1510276 RepID=A0ABQ1JGW3_9SPHN|nr:penicillin-binding protein activator [Blastomonas aquatica]
MLMLGTMFLAACQTMVPKTMPPSSPSQQPDAPTTRPDDGPIGGVLPSDETRHRIALLLPLSGKDAGVGQSLANATTLALMDTKASNIRITSYDTARGALAAARRAIADGNRLILGPLFGDDVVAIASAANAAKVPIISYSNDVGIAGNNVFVMGYVPAQSIDRVVRHARAQGITRFAALVPAGTYGQRASSAMLASVNAAGGTVVAMQSYAAGNAAVTTALKKMEQDSAYEAILIADSGAAAIRIVPLIRANGGTDARILGTELWNTERTLTTSPAMRGAWFASVSDGLYRQYATKYRAQFGSDPFRLSTLGYDSVLLTSRIARDWRPGTVFPMDKLRDSGGFIGLDGAFRFGRNGVAERLMEVQQVGVGQLTIASPAPKTFAD